jgi:hypothetical protein
MQKPSNFSMGQAHSPSLFLQVQNPCFASAYGRTSGVELKPLRLLMFRCLSMRISFSYFGFRRNAPDVGQTASFRRAAFPD